jgi:hypothetical protein
MPGPIQRAMVFGLQAAGCIYLGFWAFIGFAIIWAGFLFCLHAAIKEQQHHQKAALHHNK